MKRILIPLCLMIGTHIATGQRTHQFSTTDRLFIEGRDFFYQKNYPGCTDKLQAYKQHGKDANLLQEADYMLAYVTYIQGIKNADIVLKEHLEQYPDSRHDNEIKFMIGSVHFGREEYEKAAYWFRETNIDVLSPEQQEASTFRLAYALLQTGEEEKARGYFSRIAQIGQTYKEASTYYVSYIDYTTGKYDNALAGFEKLRNHPEFQAQSLYYITQIYFLQNKYERAMAEGEKLLARYPENDNNEEIYRIIGNAAYHLGDEAKAISMLSKYVSMTDQPLRNDLYLLGVAFFNKSTYSSAINNLSKTTLQNDALTQNAYLYLGQSYLKLNDKNNARMAFEAAATASFDKQIQEVALYNYALLVHETEFTGFGESVSIFEDFLNDFPQSKYADKVNDYLVETYLTTKNYEAALQSINKIKQPSTKIQEAKQGILFQLGTQAFANVQTEEAIDLFTKAIAVGSYDIEARNEAYFWRGESRYRLLQYQNAISDYQTYLNNTRRRDTDMYALAHYNLGYCFFKLQDYSAALSRFRHYTEAETNRQAPSLADAYNRIGDCLYRNRQFAQAEENYSRAASLSPAAGDYAVFQKGFLLGLQKEYKGKIDQMDRLMRDYPESQYVDDALFEKGRSYVLLGNDESATQTFEKLTNDFPQSSLARKGGIQLGLLYFNNNRSEKAAEAYKKVIDRYPGSEEAKVALQDLKSVYIDLNDIDAYAAYVNSLGGNIRLEVSEQDSLTYIAAEKLFMRGDNAGARRSLANYLQTFPDGAFSSNANYYLGSIAFAEKAHDETIRRFRTVISSGDTKFIEEATARIAEINYLNQDYPAALEDFKQLKIVAEKPENRQAARLGIMRCALQTGAEAEALAAAEELLKEAKISPELEVEARYVRAKAYIEQKQPDKAMADLKILSKDTRTVHGAEAKYLLAQQYFNAHEDKKAETELEEFAKNGTPHQYWLARGFILWADLYIRQGDDVQARAYLKNLQNNYKGNDDIADMIENRLAKLTN